MKQSVNDLDDLNRLTEHEDFIFKCFFKTIFPSKGVRYKRKCYNMTQPSFWPITGCVDILDLLYKHHKVSVPEFAFYQIVNQSQG